MRAGVTVASACACVRASRVEGTRSERAIRGGVRGSHWRRYAAAKDEKSSGCSLRTYCALLWRCHDLMSMTRTCMHARERLQLVSVHSRRAKVRSTAHLALPLEPESRVGLEVGASQARIALGSLGEDLLCCS